MRRVQSGEIFDLDSATYLARDDDLFNAKDEKIDVSTVDVSMNGLTCG